MPLLTPRGTFALGQQVALDVRAWPGALSLTWIGLELSPLPNPLGVLAPDFTQPHVSVYLWHNAQGVATLNLDLRKIPTSLAGRHFVMQAVAVDTNLAVGLTSPWVGVVGR